MKYARDRYKVLCLAGIPLDVMTLADTATAVRVAIDQGSRLFITTPNLHFLTLCRFDPAFRQTLRESDLCVADGMPLVWASWLLGAKLPERVAGSDLFEKLSQAPIPLGQQPISVYFYGGLPGAAAAACAHVNTHSKGMVCVGFETPGFGSVEDLSTKATLEKMNRSKADLLVIALESGKAQTWLERNRHHLTIPVICNLGAVINFQSGSIRRAPQWMQRSGVEWLWRIKEEPALWRRYRLDLNVLIVLLSSKILPYAIWLCLRRINRKLTDTLSCFNKRMRSTALTNVVSTSNLRVNAAGSHATLTLCGSIDEEVPEQIAEHFKLALSLQIPVTIALKDLKFIGPLFAGQLLRFMTAMQSSGRACQFIGISISLRRVFIWNGIL